VVSFGAAATEPEAARADNGLVDGNTRVVVVEPPRKRADLLAAECGLSGVINDDVSAVVDVMGCDLCRRRRCAACCWCDPKSCWWWFRFRCSDEEVEELPPSAVLPKDDTSPIAARRNTDMVAIFGMLIGMPWY